MDGYERRVDAVFARQSKSSCSDFKLESNTISRQRPYSLRVVIVYVNLKS